MTSKTRIGFYSGSFDPVTFGHLDVIRRAASLVERLVVGIGVHPGKAPLFSPDEKVAMLREETAEIARVTQAEVVPVFFDRLTVDAAQVAGATHIFRGLRDGTDFDYEMQMAGMNLRMAPHIATVFLPASPEVRHIAASLVRQIAQMGGDVRPFVPPGVVARLAAKLQPG